jgi:hypothetical protein
MLCGNGGQRRRGPQRALQQRASLLDRLPVELHGRAGLAHEFRMLAQYDRAEADAMVAPVVGNPNPGPGFGDLCRQSGNQHQGQKTLSRNA